MPAKRGIRKEDYKMVLDWSDYKDVKTKLPCKCDMCGETTTKSIQILKLFDKRCNCIKCQQILKKKTYIEKYGVDNPMKSKEIKDKVKFRRLDVDKEKYPMVDDWSNYKNTTTKLKCICEICKTEIIYLSIHELNDKRKKRRCVCQKCSHQHLRGDNNSMKKIGVIEKHRKAALKRSGREEWQCEVTLNKENLTNYITSLSFKPTLIELSELLGFKAWRSMTRYMREYDLYHLLEKFISTGEKGVQEYIKSLGYETKKLKIKGMEFDIFLVTENIAFEFNGVYYHSSKRRGEYYHQNKCKEAEKRNIKLYHIWEDEYLNDRDKTLKKIKNIIKYKPNIKYVNPQLIERTVQKRIFTCWSEGVILE